MILYIRSPESDASEAHVSLGFIAVFSIKIARSS